MKIQQSIQLKPDGSADIYPLELDEIGPLLTSGFLGGALSKVTFEYGNGSTVTYEPLPEETEKPLNYVVLVSSPSHIKLRPNVFRVIARSEKEAQALAADAYSRWVGTTIQGAKTIIAFSSEYPVLATISMICWLRFLGLSNRPDQLIKET